MFIRVHSFSIRVHPCSFVFHSCSFVFTRVHSCSFVFHSCSIRVPLVFTRVHSCSFVFIRVPLVFIRIHSCSLVFTRVHSCSDLCGVLDMIHIEKVQYNMDGGCLFEEFHHSRSGPKGLYYQLEEEMFARLSSA